MSCPASKVPSSARLGLTRAEALWALVLLATAVGLILGTLRADLHQAQARTSRDHLAYLAGQVSFALAHDPDHGSGWPDRLCGPGRVPEHTTLPVADLATVLHPGTWIPTDPWQGAYFLEKGEDGIWRLLCGGPDGIHPGADAASDPARQRPVMPPDAPR